MCNDERGSKMKWIKVAYSAVISTAVIISFVLYNDIQKALIILGVGMILGSFVEIIIKLKKK